MERSKVKVGDYIIIRNMVGEPDYIDRVGKVEHIDAIGQLHGTWGGLAVEPKVDKFDVAKKCCLCGRLFVGWGNNPWPLKDDGECCNDCDKDVLISRLLRF